MTSSDSEVSYGTVVAVALGTVKATDILRRILYDAGLPKIPPQVKGITATALAITGSLLLESGARRRVLTACASAGLASMLHSAERMTRSVGDVNNVRVAVTMRQ